MDSFKRIVVPVSVTEPIIRELASLDQWTNWSYQERHGVQTKVPGRFVGPPLTYLWSASNNPKTWQPLREAVKPLADDACRQRIGLGFMLLPDPDEAKNIVCVDLDDCRNPDTGELTELAQRVVKSLDSYTEVSPSGTGLHIFVYGRKPGKECGSKAAGIEMYDHLRFMAFTNQSLPGTPRRVNHRTDELRPVYYEMAPDDTPEAREAREKKRAEVAAAIAAGGGLLAARLDDRQLLDKAFAARNGDEFRRLWNGDATSCGGNNSDADWKLIGCLAWWTQNDERRIVRLMRESGLARPKYDEPRTRNSNYIEYSVRRFLERGGSADFYGSGNFKRDSLSEYSLTPENAAALAAALPDVFGPAAPRTPRPAANSPPQAAYTRVFDPAEARVPIDHVLRSEQLGDLARQPTIAEFEAEQAKADASRQAARRASIRCTRPDPTTCHCHSMQWHPEKNMGRVSRLACGAWKCLRCSKRQKQIWTPHLRKMITTEMIGGTSKPRKGPVYVETAEIDEKGWNRRRKQVYRAKGDCTRIKKGDGTCLVVATVPFESAPPMAPAAAANLVVETINGLIIYGDTKKPISTSAGWRLPKQEPSGWKRIGGLPASAKRGEIVDAIRKLGCDPVTHWPNHPFFVWAADFDPNLDQERMSNEGWIPQVTEIYDKLTRILLSIDGELTPELERLLS